MSNDEQKKKLMHEEMMNESDAELTNYSKRIYKIYLSFKQAGFTPKQSFELVKAMVVESLKPALASALASRR